MRILEWKVNVLQQDHKCSRQLFAEFMFSFCGHDGVGSTMCPVLIFLFFYFLFCILLIVHVDRYPCTCVVHMELQ